MIQHMSWYCMLKVTRIIVSACRDWSSVSAEPSLHWLACTVTSAMHFALMVLQPGLGRQIGHACQCAGKELS